MAKREALIPTTVDWAKKRGRVAGVLARHYVDRRDISEDLGAKIVDQAWAMTDEEVDAFLAMHQLDDVVNG